MERAARQCRAARCSTPRAAGRSESPPARHRDEREHDPTARSRRRSPGATIGEEEHGGGRRRTARRRRPAPRAGSGCYDVRRRRCRPGHARPTEQRVVEQEGGGREQDAYDRGDLDRQSQPPVCPPDTAWNACSRTRHSQPSPAGPARAGTVAAVFPATGPFPITALGRGAGEAKSVRGATRRPTVPAAVITGAANYVCRSREIEHDNHGADAARAPSPTRATASAATAA